MDTTQNKTATFGNQNQFTYNVDSSGTPFGAPITMPKNINTVSAADISNKNITTPPIIPVTADPNLTSTVNSALANATADEKRQATIDTQQADINAKLGDLYKVNTDIGNIGTSVDRTEENAARKLANTYATDLEVMQRDSQKRIEDFKKNFGGTTAGADIIAQRMQREDLSAQADKALLLSAATRNFETFNAIAQQQIDNNLAVLKAKSENLKAYIDINKADMDKKEQRMYDEQQKKIDAQIKKQEENENTIRDMKLLAAKNQAPASVISQLSKIDTTKPGAFDEALKTVGGYLGENQVVKLENGNSIMVNAQGKQIASFGGAKAADTNNYALTNQMVKENFNNDLVSVIANTIKSSGAKQSQSTNDAINVISGLQALAKDNPNGEFVGINPLIRLPNKLSSPEALTNRSNIEAINLKVQQWASGAALTEDQTKKVEKMTPNIGDTDKQVKSKINALANHMVSQVSGQLAGQGVGFSVDKVDMFTKPPEDELAEKYKDPEMKIKIQEAIKLYPNYSASEILQIING